MMWTYVIAFDRDLRRFLMVRSRKRGGWEMPGGGALEGETPFGSASREFFEETGFSLVSREDLYVPLGDGMVFFGLVGEGDPSRRSTSEIVEVAFQERLPGDLAYPSVEYIPLIRRAKMTLEGSDLI